uniref:Uncharacterized protein n=1 Tax=Oryza punctata TaxID=4537 RepID=A0A0E0LN21_ORYPU
MALSKCNGSRASFLVTLLLIAALLFPTVCYALYPTCYTDVEAKTVCVELDYGCTMEKCQWWCRGDGRAVENQYCRDHDTECCCTYAAVQNK